MNLNERVIDLVQYRLKSSKERLNSPRILLDIFINQDLKIYVKPALASGSWSLRLGECDVIVRGCCRCNISEAEGVGLKHRNAVWARVLKAFSAK